MDLNEYQNKAMATCMPSCDNVSYMIMNLVGEVGEQNLEKLADRKRRDKIDGDGDNR